MKGLVEDKAESRGATKSLYDSDFMYPPREHSIDNNL